MEKEDTSENAQQKIVALLQQVQEENTRLKGTISKQDARISELEGLITRNQHADMDKVLSENKQLNDIVAKQNVDICELKESIGRSRQYDNNLMPASGDDNEKKYVIFTMECEFKHLRIKQSDVKDTNDFLGKGAGGTVVAGQFNRTVVAIKKLKNGNNINLDDLRNEVITMYKAVGLEHVINLLGGYLAFGDNLADIF